VCIIRIGAAFPGEVAAWRFGAQLVRRRRLSIAESAATVAVLGGLFLWAGSGAVLMAYGAASVVRTTIENGGSDRLLYLLKPGESPNRRLLSVRREDFRASRLTPVGDGVGLELRKVLPPRHLEEIRAPRVPELQAELGDEIARKILRRGFPSLNPAGARKEDVERSLSMIVSAGGSNSYLVGLARARRPLRVGGRARDGLSSNEALALELALQEDDERRALEGELTLLESAWREAEEIAGIADRLAVRPAEG
jgi:hypothetical protein